MPAVAPITGKFGAKQFLIWLFDGFDMLASKPQGLSYSITVDTDDTDGLGDGWPEHSPTGNRSAELTQEGAFFRTDAGNSHEALKDAPADPNGAKRVGTIGDAGNTVGQPFVGFVGLVETAYAALSTRKKLQRANAKFEVTGKAEDGQIVHPFSIETADANTEASSADNTTAPQQVIPIQSSSVANPTVVTTQVPHGLITGETVLISGHTSTPTINGERTVTVTGPTTFTVPVNVSVGGGANGSFVKGKTMSGAAGYLEVSTLTLGGHTGLVYTLRHSDDDAVFVDLVAFTARTLFGAERVTVAGAVRRYVAGSHDFTGAGSPSSKFFAGIART